MPRTTSRRDTRRPARVVRRTRRRSGSSLARALPWLEVPHGALTSCVGITLALLGLGLDVALHTADAHLASHESPLTLANPGHVLLILGFGLVVIGTSAVLIALDRERRTSAYGWGAVALLTAALMVGGPALVIDNMGGEHDQTEMPGAHQNDGHGHGETRTLPRPTQAPTRTTPVRSALPTVPPRP